MAGATRNSRRTAFRCWPAGPIPVYRDFVAPRTVEAATVADTSDFAPRVGFAYDLTGDNRTVLKVFGGMFNFNSADDAGRQGKPGRPRAAALQLPRPNGNRLLDGRPSSGTLNSTQGGGGFVRIDRELNRPTASEMSVNLEREIVPALSGRVSYVYKNIRNVWGEIDAIRTPAYTVPFTIVDIGADNVAGTGRRPAVPDLRPAAVVPDGADSAACSRIASTPTPRTTRPTSTPSKSRSTAGSRTSGCC